MRLDQPTIDRSVEEDKPVTAPPSLEEGRWLKLVAPIMRAASHIAIWTIILIPCLMQMADGWTATRDDADISIGAWQVLTPHFPLVGLASEASSVGFWHSLFDLGPLLFWMLAIPVHVDPTQGALWGAALACGIALSIAVEASYSAIGWPGAAFVALVTLDLNWKTHMFARLVWNPYVGLVFLMAATAIAWRVATGGFGWWPLAVLTASVAAQCHLSYVATAVGLVVAAPLIALLLGRRPERLRWIVVGGGVAFICWISPLIQELTSSSGNISALLRSDSDSRRAGTLFGLHALATATTAKPIWLTNYPFLTSLDLQFPQYLEHHNIAWALGSLLVLVVIALYARHTGRTKLAAAALIALVLSLALVVSYSAFPEANLGPSGYLANVLWPVGTIVWATILWALAAIALDAWQSRHRLSAAHQGQVLLRWSGAIGGALLLVVATIAAVSTLATASPLTPSKYSDAPMDKAIAASVEAAVKPGHVIFEVRPSVFATPGIGFGAYVVDYWGVAYILLRDGWQPAITYQFYGTATHLTVPKGAHWPTVVVDVGPKSFSVIGTQVWRDGHEISRSFQSDIRAGRR
jgi:hypothetical protein